MLSDAEITNYDSIADAFLKHIERPNSWNKLYERPNMIARLPDLNGKNVLDIGSSSGFFTNYALEHGAAVTGIDASKVMIQKLKGRIKSPKLKLHCADIGQPMTFLKSESYDVIICSLVIDYIKDWASLFAEFRRVLKTGGRIIIATHHPFGQFLYIRANNYPDSYYSFRLFEDTWAEKGNEPFKTHYYIRPLNEVLRPIINSGFKIISIDEPLPDENCKKIDQVLYERLMDKPGWLFFVLEK
jgi:SAM-dependent methyltransferase